MRSRSVPTTSRSCRAACRGRTVFRKQLDCHFSLQQLLHGSGRCIHDQDRLGLEVLVANVRGVDIADLEVRKHARNIDFTLQLWLEAGAAQVPSARRKFTEPPPEAGVRPLVLLPKVSSIAVT